MLSFDEQIEVVSRLGSLLDARVPLPVALRTLAEEIPSARQQKVFSRMARDLDAGTPLLAVVESVSGQVSPWLSAVLQAGVRSGSVPDCLRHYVMYARRYTVESSGFFSCLLYPTLLLLFGMLIVMFLLASIVPHFAGIFEGFGTELPTATQVLIDFSRYVSAAPIAITVCSLLLLLSPILLMLYQRWFRLPDGFWWCLHHLPGIGGIVRSHAVSETLHLLAVMLAGRMPLHEAFALAGLAVRNPCVGRSLLLAGKQLESGVPVTELSTYVPALPREILRAGSWTDPDSLAESLRNQAEFPALQAGVLARMLSLLVTPMTVLALGGFLVFVVIALFLPLIRLLNDLS